jgi:hypothetical protein
MIIETGWYCELAPRLAEEFETVYYWSPWQGDFPYSQDYAVGSGLENVMRVKDLWDFVPDVDLFVFPADGFEDIQWYLKSQGKRVWGSGYGSQMEADRVMLKNYLVQHDLPIIEYAITYGMESLYKLLHDEEDIYIKLSRGARGDTETYHHWNWELSRTWFNNLAAQLGPMSERQTFLWERPTEGFEGGMDWIAVGQQYSNEALVGYEIKDSCYVSVVQRYSRISQKLTKSADALRDYFEAVKYANLVSTEVRIAEDGTAYMIDLAARFPWPPAGTQMANIENLGEMMWFGSAGTMVQPHYRKRFGVELNITAPSLSTDWLAVELSESARKHFMFHAACKFGNTYWLRPQHAAGDSGYVGTCIAIGDDFQSTKKLCIEMSEELKGQKLETDVSDLEKAEAEIAKGEKAGIPWWD